MTKEEYGQLEQGDNVFLKQKMYTFKYFLWVRDLNSEKDIPYIEVSAINKNGEEYNKAFPKNFFIKNFRIDAYTVDESKEDIEDNDNQ